MLCGILSGLYSVIEVENSLVTAGDPQSNGGAERQGGTLFGAVRAQLIDQNLSPAYATFAAHNTMYVLNRVPIPPATQSPIHRLTLKKPHARHIHVFGSHCTYWDDPAHKISHRGHAARFLMVADFGYCLLDTAKRRIVTRRHVIFKDVGPVVARAPGLSGGGGGVRMVGIAAWWCAGLQPRAE